MLLLLVSCPGFVNKAGQNTMNRQNKTAPKSVTSEGMWWQLKLRTSSGDAELLQKAFCNMLNEVSQLMGKEVGRKFAVLG